ncbi:MAG: ribokinase [Eubacteriales bacterium]|nr:ribokinase [Eubacteriales bacterium]MDD4474710.1 ribokinase [Eubacteriales bacterium]
MDNRLLVVGSANMDMLLRCGRIPSAGETVLSYDSYGYAPGGKGANAACAAKKLGADVVFCTRIGKDTNGSKLYSLYESIGIDMRCVYTDKVEQTGLAVVLVEKNGTNRIIVYPGANTKISDRDIEDAFLSYPDAVMTQFEIGEDAVVYTARAANENNVPLIVDAGPARADYPIGKLGRIEIFSPNESETNILTGIQPGSVEDCLRASSALCSKGDIKYVVLKLGDRGAFIYDGKYFDIVPSYFVNAVDTTAAGDAFTAALATEYIRNGKDIFKACKYANAVGALTVTKPGAYTSLPDAEEVKRFIEKNTVADTE